MSFAERKSRSKSSNKTLHKQLDIGFFKKWKQELNKAEITWKKLCEYIHFN